MRQQQQGQPFKDLIPNSAMVPRRLRLVIIADIGKGSTILEVLVLIYMLPRPRSQHALYRYCNLVTTPCLDGSVRRKGGR